MAGHEHFAGLVQMRVIRHVHEEIHARGAGKAMIAQGEGEAIPVRLDLADYLPRILHVFGGFDPGGRHEGGQVAHEGVANLGFVLQHQNG